MLLPILRQIEQKTLVERSARGLRAAAGVSFGPSGVGIFPEFVRSNHTWWAAEATPPAPDVIDGEIGPGRATRTNSSASRGDPRGITACAVTFAGSAVGRSLRLQVNLAG